MLNMKSSNEIEVYVSEPGYLVFKTYREEWQDQIAQDKNVVSLSYEQALILQNFLPKLIAEQEKAWNGGLEKEKDAD